MHVCPNYIYFLLINHMYLIFISFYIYSDTLQYRSRTEERVRRLQQNSPPRVIMASHEDSCHFLILKIYLHDIQELRFISTCNLYKCRSINQTNRIYYITKSVQGKIEKRKQRNMMVNILASYVLSSIFRYIII